MNEQPTMRILDNADPDALFRAVVEVHTQYCKEGKKPGSECWSTDTRRYRPQMVNDVLVEWSRSSGTDAVFPWHDDYVAAVWVSFRKSTQSEKSAAYEHFGIEPPTNK